MGEIDGKSGFFNVNYVEILPDDEPEKHEAKDAIKARVMYDFKPWNDDELELKVGSLVTVITLTPGPPGWWMGEIGGKSGLFPGNYVEILPDDEKTHEEESTKVPTDGERGSTIEVEQQLQAERTRSQELRQVVVEQQQQQVVVELQLQEERTRTQELQQQSDQQQQAKQTEQDARVVVEQQLQEERTRTQELQQQLVQQQQAKQTEHDARVVVEQQLQEERRRFRQESDRLQVQKQTEHDASIVVEQQLQDELTRFRQESDRLRVQKQTEQDARIVVEQKLQVERTRFRQESDQQQQANQAQHEARVVVEQQLQGERTRSQELQQELDQQQQANQAQQDARVVVEQQLQEERTISQELQQELVQQQQANQAEHDARVVVEQQLQEERTRSQELQQEDQLQEANQAEHDTRVGLQQQVQELTRQLEGKYLRVNELELTLSIAQRSLEESRQPKPCDWVLDRHEIILTDNVIGVGAWGSVLEGSFRKCTVAVKQIHDLILSPHNRRLFEREMDIASRCRHPCLLQFIGATNEDDLSPLFVTELLDTSLWMILRERALASREIKALSLDVGQALNYLHENRPMPIIHRDISSSNVLLWKHHDVWRAKVSDYGTANFMQHSMTANPGAVVYSAPEAQTPRQSPKLDVYSFGVLLCEMNIREIPDPQHRQEQVALVTSHVFRDLIRRCLEGDYERRPSMAEVIDAIEVIQV